MFAKGRHESWLDVLRQIADESERQKAGVTEWVGSVVRAEVGLAWREIDPDPLALVPNVSCLIDDTTVERCRAALGAGGRSLWFLSSDDPETFTTSAKEALKEHVVSWAPEGMFNAKQVVVVSLGLLDVVMLRHTTPPLAWDYSDRGGVDLFLEQLLAIDVIRRPKAVQFTRLP